MKKILILIVTFTMGVGIANAGVRDGNTTSRGGGAVQTTTQKRVSTVEKSDRTIAPRATVLGAPRVTSSNVVKSRGTTQRDTKTVTRTAQAPQNVAARAAETITTTETRTGAQYEACKSAYFTCMDQFCALKNDDYRRCSCSDRINSLASARNVLTAAGEQLTVFTENLDVVGMTAAQATAMHTATDGENALTSDTSASKALLQAIMNSIRGGDTTVGGKYSDLNSINISLDTSAVFSNDSSQIVALYNGRNLYSAVYPQCRNAVRADCNDASLQRAVNAYLMAVEQDCNTVQTAIEKKQAETKAAIREGSAMLDLARVENRQRHNSDSITECINNVESAILSEEVCGANYHKCLDNGEFIDISTGAPITGVVKFYELGKLLTFNSDVDAAMQQLSKISKNKTFVNNFEKRTKKFAKPALDKCTEIADEVWSEYLDKAMLAIYYAQQSKVSEIQQGCFDFVSQCYESTDASITTAMAELMGESAIILQPSKIKLSTQLCSDYVDSCNNMFKADGVGDIITQYVTMRESADVLAACRAVVKQCFDKYGGTGYENFYYPYSGLFDAGGAPDWFTLYDVDGTLKSPCAQQLNEIASCRNTDTNKMLDKAFGGFDAFYVSRQKIVDENDNVENDNVKDIIFKIENTGESKDVKYGIKGNPEYVSIKPDDDSSAPQSVRLNRLRHRELRSVGVATEVYNQIIDTLATQCRNIDGRFMEIQFLQNGVYNTDNYCKWNASGPSYSELISGYKIADNENMCPRDYGLSVDTQSWGACSCWGNGGRRSKNGRSATCMAILPTSTDMDSTETSCDGQTFDTASTNPKQWCTQTYTDGTNRLCPAGCTTTSGSDSTICACNGEEPAYLKNMVPEGI